jgi:solute carrier family 35 (probable UDP-sugar transporter), member A4
VFCIEACKLLMTLVALAATRADRRGSAVPEDSAASLHATERGEWLRQLASGDDVRGGPKAGSTLLRLSAYEVRARVFFVQGSECRTRPLTCPVDAQMSLLVVPAFSYALNNNLAVLAQQEMDAASFVVLSNTKILTTALLCVTVLGRRFSLQKWAAIPLLFLGTALATLSSPHGVASSDSTTHVSQTGLSMLAVYALNSGASAVYSEWVLQRLPAHSIHEQNVPLYTMGLVINGIAWAVHVHQADTGHSELLYGFNTYVWIIVVTQAINGILLSVVMKTAGSMARTFVIAGATIFGTILSAAVFQMSLGGTFVLASTLVVAALVMYQTG